MKYSKGNNYRDIYLNTEERPTRVTKITKKDYGYRVQMFNNYITLYYVKLIINSDGTAKAKVKIDKNYNPIRYYTLYFDKQGYQIGGETRKALKIYKQLRYEKTNNN